MNAVSYGLICQELERGDSGLRSFVSVQSSLCMYPIHTYGSEEQRQQYLPRMARGEIIGCFGLTEPHGGSDPVNMKTHAKRRGSDWVINGAKMWITNAPIADLFVVWARTEEGIRGFLIEKGAKGLAAPEIEKKFSLRASVTGAIFFEDVVVPRREHAAGQHVRPEGAAVVPDPGTLRHHLGRHRRGAGVPARGARVFEDAHAVRQADRGDAGRADPARGNGAQDHDGAVAVAAARAPQGCRAMSPSHVSLAKWNNCRAAIEIARDARDILGGAGISAEYVPIRHALNLESVITYEGTETIHQLTVGRELTGHQRVLSRRGRRRSAAASAAPARYSEVVRRAVRGMDAAPEPQGRGSCVPAT